MTGRRKQDPCQTPEEYALIPPGCASVDAGQTGPERRRTP